MQVLNNGEMLDVTGGSISMTEAGIIGGIVIGVVSFFAGVLSGIVDPEPCRIKVNVNAR